MIEISWIFMFALAVKLSTCTKEGSTTTYFDIEASTPSPVCIREGLNGALVSISQLPEAIEAAQNDSTKQNNLLRQLQEWWYYPVWYNIQAIELEKSIKVWSTLKTDLDSQMKRFQYTRIRVWLESLETAYFFPGWLCKVKSFTRYEKWLIGCSTCQEERWNIFKQAINDKYGNSTKEGTIALAKAISDLHSEVSSEIPYYHGISLKVPETDREIADLCSVFGEPTTIKHVACKLVIRAQSLGYFLLGKKRTGTNPHSILYGIIRSKNVCETFKIITEHFTNKNSSATTTGVENCIMNVDMFIENTNLVTFFATCSNTVTNEEESKSSNKVYIF